MDKRKISILLVLSLLLTGSIGVGESYASEGLNIVSEVLETVPVENYSLAEDEEPEREGVVSGTYMTTPVSGNTEEGSEDGTDNMPEGVVQMVAKTTPVDENGNEAKGTETQEITGRSSMPDASELGLYAKDIVNMVMPVIPEDTYDFVMDSDDLLSRYSVYKDSYEKASLYFTNTTGEKKHTCISDVAMAKNKSSVPVLLYVTLQVENEYGWPINFTDMDSVEADNGKNISFALIPVSANTAGTDTDMSGDEAMDQSIEDQEADDAGTDEYKIYRDRMISVDETGKAEMILYLPGTPDNFDLVNDKYMAKEDAVWSSLGFAVTGACNTKADWSEMDDRSNAGEMLGIHISYRMDLLSEEQEELIANGFTPDPETGVIVFDTVDNAQNDDEDVNTEDVDGNIEDHIETEIREDNKSGIKDDEYLKESIDDKEELKDEL